MEYVKGKIVKLLVDFFETDVRRIHHALSVLKEAEIICQTAPQGFDEDLVIAVALLHDVGIKPSEKELGYNNGKTQEQYGPPVVEKLLGAIEFSPDQIRKACDIVGNHHSPSRFDYPELEILRKADHIVNIREEGMSKR